MADEKIKVLVVEDHAVAKKIALAILGALNCQVDMASDGDEALELFAKNRYQLILVDLGLPSMDGFELTQKIQTMKAATQKLAIVALTAHCNNDYKKRCLELGMNAFLSKPLTTEIAKAMLNNIVRH